jgi:hypothetical protein
MAPLGATGGGPGNRQSAGGGGAGAELARAPAGAETGDGARGRTIINIATPAITNAATPAKPHRFKTRHSFEQACAAPARRRHEAH